MNSLAISSSDHNQEQLLKERKGSFFFRLERELEKVNLFYLQKESELKIRLDILIEKKQQALAQGRLDDNRNSVAFISLYEGFKKFSKDLERLEQFVELNEVGFTKVLKKWDKRSKSHTKELYLTTAVNVQPVFHRDEIIELSDLVANNLLELEAKAEGESVVGYTKGKTSSQAARQQTHIQPIDQPDSILPDDIKSSVITTDKAVDEAYNHFVRIATSTAISNSSTMYQAQKQTIQQQLQQQSQIKQSQQQKPDDAIHAWCEDFNKELLTGVSEINLAKLLLLLIANPKISDRIVKIFYEYFKGSIALSTMDELSGRNCLHEAALSPNTSERLFIVQLALDAHVECSLKDSSGRTPLHYAIESNRIDVVEYILPNLPPGAVDISDNDSMTPLLMAIVNVNVSCVKMLLSYGANPIPKQNSSSQSYLPLNVACKVGSFEIVRVILESASQCAANTDVKEIFQPNAEGLLPLHIVANFGHYQLVEPLIKYGAKVNQLDKLNKWSPIFYSAAEGYSQTSIKLIEFGADFKLRDEEGFTPLYYAAWEGNVGVLNVFIETLGKQMSINSDQMSSIEPNDLIDLQQATQKHDILSPMLTNKSSALIPEISNLDMIPDLSLPPPILPLRKYGHNFLEKKMFVKLNFYTNRDSIKLYDNQFISSVPGRITINCAQNDIIPRSLLLPVSDDDKTVTFQVDSLDNFSIDFELFPTFGTRLIAKTTLLSSAFASSTARSCYKSSDTNHNINMNGDLAIPLFDVRLKNLGELRFNYQIIYPYSGLPLEISQYDTYWKSTNNNNSNNNNNNGNSTNTVTKATYLSFVTDSSLSGEYYRVNVCNLNDGTPVVCPNWQIQLAQGLDVPIANLTLSQLQKKVSQDEQNKYLNRLKQLRDFSNEKVAAEIRRILKKLYVPLDVFLKEIPLEISLDLEIFYPTLYEENFSNLKIAQNAMGFGNNLNEFMNSILTCVFDHVRWIRNNGGVHSKSRPIIFSSANSVACTILNWKQPNYPVFYIMNGITFSTTQKKFHTTSANGFPISTDVIDEIKKEQLKKQLKTSHMLNNAHQADGTIDEYQHQMSIDNIDSINKKSSSYNNELLYQALVTRSIKLGINFVTQNNLLGIIVPNKLLNVCPSLIKTIRSRGLILVASKDEATTKSQQSISCSSIMEDDDDDQEQDMKEIEECDEGLSDSDDKEFLHSIVECYNNDDEDGEVNGLRFKDILSFKDAIDM